MSTQRYSVAPHPIDTLLAWVKSGEIAIPEIQRPFVWDATRVRNLLDSLYKGFPVGYLIAWRNPNVKLKDGTLSAGKRILIDGQQRVTALMAGLLGQEVLTKDYESVRIRIAFHPVEEKFEVSNPAIQKDAAWIPDIAEVFRPGASVFGLVNGYAAANPGIGQDELFRRIERLRGIVNNHIGIIELAEDLDIETVTEIFIRVNSAGAALSQADFAMSKIAANESYGGNALRKAIEYFCHMAVQPDFHGTITRRDAAFAATDYFQKMAWLRNVQDDIYDPSYTDMLRVAFTSEFGRGKLQDLVALLSGRNFETKQYEDAIAEESFARLRQGVVRFINETSFKQLVMILRSAGFVSSDLIGGKNAVNFAYILYLRGKATGMDPAAIERMVRRWYVMSVLTGRYAGNPETAFDFDIRQIEGRGPGAYVDSVVAGELSEGFWSTLLPQQMETSSASSPQFLVFLAAQVKMGDRGFLSRDITVQDLILNKSDVHHIFPRSLLKKQGLSRGRYNQIANFAVAQSEINIRISDRAPSTYFADLLAQCETKVPRYGGITEHDELIENLRQHCIPEAVFGSLGADYEAFLDARRKLMAEKIRHYYALL
ncbi:MAG TPA: DUF262 domain-containing protein [Azospirillaceae bacterium]|nr:DUF262 domain-containing protein [Azospirillaceae bacterium]